DLEGKLLSAIPCGHTYCMYCMNYGYRQTFTPRPVLGKNTMLAEVLEKLKKTKLQAVHPDQCYAGSGDVECDVCTGDKNKAIMSCLVCLNSYCQNHLEQHETFFRGKGHNLMDATGQLQEMICPQHEKLLEIFCRSEQKCICLLCMVEEHKNHNTISVAAERTEKQLNKIRNKNKTLASLNVSLYSRLFDLFPSDSHQFTLEINTVHKRICLSEGNRVITYTDTVQPYPDHPDRFDTVEQVLCRESVCGRHYWEVEWSGKVGISSWRLFCSPTTCLFWHNNKKTRLPVVSSSSRIGVYVDHSAGTLSFYSVSDTMNLIHRVHTTFTQPLYAGLRVNYTFGSVSKVKLCELNCIEGTENHV
uniref:B box-type domain-containing protein n=1 Tax=Sinocyclocheilus anshuiensis TaxID=1608454 RepID=A0A671NFI0_9TELE